MTAETAPSTDKAFDPRVGVDRLQAAVARFCLCSGFGVTRSTCRHAPKKTLSGTGHRRPTFLGFCFTSRKLSRKPTKHFDQAEMA
ncbi:hypothetical protein ONE63_005194 [Megalurothrips usitatus]|uniref:Uncharacterized protein n=1 Tax=Megalurothrips usitatus TaxID=439358 RepID=A0AAV7XYJ8_9NEOP|nr:hypothetical protein ONE63_005194 [Megalurothrips usitatus]